MKVCVNCLRRLSNDGVDMCHHIAIHVCDDDDEAIMLPCTKILEPEHRQLDNQRCVSKMVTSDENGFQLLCKYEIYSLSSLPSIVCRSSGACVYDSLTNKSNLLHGSVSEMYGCASDMQPFSGHNSFYFLIPFILHPHSLHLWIKSSLN